MKKLFAVLLSILIFSSPVFAVTLAWDQYGGNEDGFMIYFRVADSEDEPFSYKIEGTDTTEFSISNDKFLPGIEYECWITAYNDRGQSEPSNVVKWSVAKFVPIENPAPTVVAIPGNVKTLIFKMME